jgi:hypothetical protein
VFRRDIQGRGGKDRGTAKEDGIRVPAGGKSVVKLEISREVRDAAIEAHRIVEDNGGWHEGS